MKKLLLAPALCLAFACGGQTFEAGTAGAGGVGQAGTGQGGSTTGGAAGKSGQSGAGGSAGGIGCGCTTNANCGAGQNCASGVCKEKVPGRCWDDDDCGAGATCQGASICPCNNACAGEDTPGSCKGTMTTDWSSCAKSGECLLAANTCCGTCTTPKATDLDAVNYTKVQPHFEEVCPSPEACPGCASQANPDLSAMCRQSKCAVVDVSNDEISACKVDADCTLHAANQCCNCAILPESEYVAIASSQMQAYELEVCGPGMGPCNLKCSSTFPSGITAKCGPSGHCRVAQAKPAVTCPPMLPQAGPCPMVGLVCEYGESVSIGCRTQATCSAGGWAAAAASCPAPIKPGQDGCPTTVAGGGGACTGEGVVCTLTAPGSSCLCTSCAGGPCTSTAKWACAKGGTAPCPNVAPNFGQPCLLEGQSCTYGVNCTSTGATRECKGGVWTDVSVACPL